jgi:hypothetical protein
MFDGSISEGGECGCQCTFGKRCSMIEKILTGMIARYRRTFTCAKWEAGKAKFYT